MRGLNRNAYAFLVGTKYDLYTTMPAEEQRDIDKQVRGGEGHNGTTSILFVVYLPSFHVVSLLLMLRSLGRRVSACYNIFRDV